MEELQTVRARCHDLEERSSVSDVADHSNCINIKIHKAKMGEYAAKTKESANNEMKFKL
jgi:hypothetical protein